MVRATITRLQDALTAERLLMPELWLKASCELLFLTVIACLAITAAVKPSVLVHNPIKTVLGHNNPCVVWDSPPALYFSAVMFCFIFYCTLRFVVTDSQRAVITNASDTTPCKRRVTHL